MVKYLFTRECFKCTMNNHIYVVQMKVEKKRTEKKICMAIDFLYELHSSRYSIKKKLRRKE